MTQFWFNPGVDYDLITLSLLVMRFSIGGEVFGGEVFGGEVFGGEVLLLGWL
ncbi:MAG: hypothetical protein HC800_06100 [Phormidesmis sp. RL_2_1]|nr:hypothetical protein [Phormidesmis sp. RL_2_1]